MPLRAPDAIDTRAFFRPLGRELVALLSGLPEAAWDRPTVAPGWVVRDVVAHLTDTALRRLSLHRDGLRRSGQPPASEAEVAAIVNGLNASWVAVARRFSPGVLTALYRTAVHELADFFEALPFDAPALFPVSWAGENESAGWFDVAREFTEQWHHQAQIRDAVGAPPFPDPAWLSAVLQTAMRGLPHAYRNTPAPVGKSVVLDVSGPSGGIWTLHREDAGWRIAQGEDSAAQGEDSAAQGEASASGSEGARASMTDDTAWRLLFNALTPEVAARRVTRNGDAQWTEPLLLARSVIL